VNSAHQGIELRSRRHTISVVGHIVSDQTSFDCDLHDLHCRRRLAALFLDFKNPSDRVGCKYDSRLLARKTRTMSGMWLRNARDTRSLSRVRFCANES
jgi:hypothetical protein